MSARPPAQLGQSPLEIVAVPLVISALAVGGILWGAGVVIGSILGSSLPGEVGEGIAAMARSFPDVGAAWEPPISSWPLWVVTVAVLALIGPLVWKLFRSSRLTDQGAQWATPSDLRRAGLVVADLTLPDSIPETPDDA